MNKIDVAGLKIDALAKTELIDILKNRISANQPTWVTTVYSEFLYAALKDPKVLAMLNEADISVPDGIGIFWAHKFLSLPLTAKSYYGKILQSLWQVKYSLFFTLVNPKYCSVPTRLAAGDPRRIYRQPGTPINLPSTPIGDGHVTQAADRIPGSDLIWDLSQMASENNLSIYLLGGYGDTPKIVSQKIQETISRGRENLFPGLKIVGYSNKNSDDIWAIEDIKKSMPDILMVAYGPIKQEQWIYKHREELTSVKLFIGLGGTFDYIAGKRVAPPSFVRKIGLEWLFRLITQPHRIGRIWNATFGLIAMLMRYKVFNTYPIRKNCVAVIINPEGKVFVGRKTGTRVDIISTNEPDKWKNYWQFPQGGIEGSEDAAKAIKREIKEETGIKNLEFLKFSKQTNTYLWNNALRKLSRKNYGYKFKGQTQTIAYFQFTGSESEIVLPKGEEFVEYQWLRPDELIKTIHEERKNLTEIVVKDLKEMQEKAII